MLWDLTDAHLARVRLQERNIAAALTTEQWRVWSSWAIWGHELLEASRNAGVPRSVGRIILADAQRALRDLAFSDSPIVARRGNPAVRLTEADLVGADDMNERGRPLEASVRCWVLWAIGGLDHRQVGERMRMEECEVRKACVRCQARLRGVVSRRSQVAV
jgi:hypothetical protein